LIFLLHASRFTLHASRFTLHASRFTLPLRKSPIAGIRSLSLALFIASSNAMGLFYFSASEALTKEACSTC